MVFADSGGIALGVPALFFYPGDIKNLKFMKISGSSEPNSPKSGSCAEGLQYWLQICCIEEDYFCVAVKRNTACKSKTKLYLREKESDKLRGIIVIHEGKDEGHHNVMIEDEDEKGCDLADPIYLPQRHRAHGALQDLFLCPLCERRVSVVPLLKVQSALSASRFTFHVSRIMEESTMRAICFLFGLLLLTFCLGCGDEIDQAINDKA